VFLKIDIKSILYKIRNTMKLEQLGLALFSQRKALKLSATATAEAAGVSRVTLHRIERGEPSVSMGAYAVVAQALGMSLQALPLEKVPLTTSAATTDAIDPAKPLSAIPVRIQLNDYPVLKSLAWHMPGASAVSPPEAFDLYERNARHIDASDLAPNEQALMSALQEAFTWVAPKAAPLMAEQPLSQKG
jgi:transcriptional regulator with XRE-family HTH domain